MSELFHHMGMLGLQKGQIFGSIHPCNRVLFYIVGDAQITLFCLLVPRSGWGMEGWRGSVSYRPAALLWGGVPPYGGPAVFEVFSCLAEVECDGWFR